MTDKRLIEEAFPLKQASLDSVHEKNVRHGHISTLHIWPARRPLAACRAALIAALLPDPGDAQARQTLVRRIGGTLVDDGAGGVKTEGGVLRWGHESTPDMDYFREEIKKAFGGRAPKVLDMFAGGGAIPLEAMRLGCDVTAIDYNPVAWFLLKCTLEYPSKLAGKRWPLPVAKNDGKLVTEEDGDLAAHVRYWGNWVLERARADLAPYYPTLPLDPSRPESQENPLCPTVAYLWARTVPHPDPTKNGLQVPLLKTLWLCKKAGKKRALKLKYNAEANRFDFDVFTPKGDDEVGKGTMSRTGVQCPPTGTDLTGSFFRSDYLQKCGKEGKMTAVCTAVIVDVPRPQRHLPYPQDSAGEIVSPGKEYRLPHEEERKAAECAVDVLSYIATEIPLGLPTEPILPPDSRAVFVHLYGLDNYSKLFTPRQLLALGTFIKHIRAAKATSGIFYDDPFLVEALTAYIYTMLAKLLDRGNALCSWESDSNKIGHLFKRFAIPMIWDFCEGIPIADFTGGWEGSIDWTAKYVEHATRITAFHAPNVLNASATHPIGVDSFDAIVTDPPYYDAIPYADLSDFFYVWLRRTVGDAYGSVFAEPLTPKPGELVQHAGRHATKQEAKQFYEDGMEQSFCAACRALKPDGRMVIVFAHKQPDAWETLVGAMIRAGFVVTASWPIDTEMGNRTRAQNSAALSSSVWLVCRKRPTNAGKGWYKQVQPRMKERITERLRYFWDEGVRGPDFLWAAVGPGLEAFSAYDEVRKLNGEAFTVGEFLKEVRRVTTDFALGQIVHGGTEGLDDWTRFALMHAQNFGMAGAPVGESILLAGAYGLDLNLLLAQRGILTKGKPKAASGDDEDAGDGESGGSGAEVRLLSWDERKRDDLGEPQESGDLYTIDMLHRLMREWASGDVSRAAYYADQQGLGQNDLFWRVAQAFVEMGALQSKERSMLEAIISWGRGRVPSFNGSAPRANETTQIPKPQTIAMDFDGGELT